MKITLLDLLLIAIFLVGMVIYLNTLRKILIFGEYSASFLDFTIFLFYSAGLIFLVGVLWLRFFERLNEIVLYDGGEVVK